MLFETLGCPLALLSKHKYIHTSVCRMEHNRTFQLEGTYRNNLVQLPVDHLAELYKLKSELNLQNQFTVCEQQHLQYTYSEIRR